MTGITTNINFVNETDSILENFPEIKQVNNWYHSKQGLCDKK